MPSAPATKKKSTTTTPPAPTAPDPYGGTDASRSPDIMNRLEGFFKRIAPMLMGSSVGAPANAGAGGGAGTAPIVSPAIRGQAPAPLASAPAGAPVGAGATPGGAGAPGVNGNGGMPAPIGQQRTPVRAPSMTSMPTPWLTSMPKQQFNPLPAPATGDIPLEYSTPGGRKAGIAHGIFQGFTQMANRIKQQKFDKASREAEFWVRAIAAAMERGDRQFVDQALQRPEVQKLIEKGFIPKGTASLGSGAGGEQKQAKPKPPTPEQTGAQRAIQQIAQGGSPQGQPPQGSPPARSVPPAGAPAQGGEPPMPTMTPSLQQQQQALVQQHQLDITQNEPDMARRMAIGTGLSADQLMQQELAEAGFEIAPAVQKQMEMQMGADQRMKVMQLVSDLFKTDQMLIVEARGQDMQKYIAQMGEAGAKERARIATGPDYARVRAMQENFKAGLELKEKSKSSNLMGVLQRVSQYARAQASALRAQAQKYFAAEEEEKAKQYEDMAAARDREAQAIEDQLKSSNDAVINQILGLPEF